MIKDLKDYWNFELGKTAVICGLGPSLSESIDWIKNNENDLVIISCNDVDLLTNLTPNYWVHANSVDTIYKLSDRFSKYPNSVIVHADSVDSTPRQWINNNFKSNVYIGYDQRHFNGLSCPNCANGCANLIKERKTIQEQLKDYTNFDSKYSTGDTVAVHMLALAVLLGCNKIYITGVDLDYTKGYYNTNFINHDTFDPYLSNILNDFKIINDSAKNIGVEIINLSGNSKLSSHIKTETI
jgi:hypothetical protein